MSTDFPGDYTPLSYQVPVGNYSEADLIRALDLLMAHFEAMDGDGDGWGRQRAADWLHAKYGSRR